MEPTGCNLEHPQLEHHRPQGFAPPCGRTDNLPSACCRMRWQLAVSELLKRQLQYSPIDVIVRLLFPACVRITCLQRIVGAGERARARESEKQESLHGREQMPSL